MNIHDDWFLVVGYGSIGRRHFQNLLKLGFKDVRLLCSGTGRVGAFENPVDGQRGENNFVKVNQ